MRVSPTCPRPRHRWTWSPDGTAGACLLEHGNAGWFDIASLLEVTEEGILLDSRVHLSPARDRILSFSMIHWIGPAVPLATS